MLLWTVIALLTAAAVMAVLVPLGRAPDASRSADRARRVYLDQLDELDRDRAQGRISDMDAEEARAEIARRLLATEQRRTDAAGGHGSRRLRRAVAVLAIAGIPALSLGFYLSLGAPNLAGQPLAARLASPSAPDDIAMLVSRVEEHLSRAPEDGQGWEVIAPVYLRLGRAGEAVTAYRNAIRLLGSTGPRHTALGEAIVATEGGVITADARLAFEAARAAEPNSPAPRFFLALAAEQEGRVDDAAAELRALLADAPADAPWRQPVSQALARLEPATVPTAGPTDVEVAAAADMEPADQSAMIEGMVTRLADRLKDEPADVEGWLRLIRSYVVLGREVEAQAAIAAARAGVQGETDRQRVEALVADLGLGSAGASMP